MTGLDALNEEVAVMMADAKRMSDAVDIVRVAVDQLVCLGFQPTTAISPEGFFVLRLDRDLVLGPVIENGLPPAPEKTPVPAKSASPDLPPEAELVTGPWSAEEEQTLAKMIKSGNTQSEIAAYLKRKSKDVSNKKYRLNKRIKKASPFKSKREGPATTSPKPRVENDPPVSPVQDVNNAAAPDAPVAAGASNKPTTPTDWTAHLAQLGNTGTWTPGRDLKLCDYMFRGMGIGGAAAMLKIDRENVDVRWTQLTNGLPGFAPGQLKASDGTEAFRHALEDRTVADA